MTQPHPDDEAEDIELLLDQLEFEAECDAACDNMDDMLELLAWVIRQEAAPRNLADAAARPDFRLIENCVPVALEWLARWDVSINDLVRHELADAIEVGDELAARWAGLAARLLRSERPIKRGPNGDHPARDALIVSAFELANEWRETLQGLKDLKTETKLGECLKLCVSERAHAVFRYVQASKRPANIMAS